MTARETMMRRFEYSLFADHFQFYLQDEAVEGSLAESWTEEATARMMALGDGVVGIGTARNVTVPVEVQIHEGEPELQEEVWDRYTEGSIEVRGARLVVAGCSDFFPDAPRIDVEPGTYRLRALFSGLKSVSEDGMDGDDRYCVQLWRAEDA